MHKTGLRNMAHTATAALFSWTSFQFLVKNWHSIMGWYIYAEMMQEETNFHGPLPGLISLCFL